MGPLGLSTWILLCVWWEPLIGFKQTRAVNCTLPAPMMRLELEGREAEVMCTESHSKMKGDEEES